MTAADKCLGLVAERLLFRKLFNAMKFLPTYMAWLKAWVIHACAVLCWFCSYMLTGRLLGNGITFWHDELPQGSFWGCLPPAVIYVTFYRIDVYQEKKLLESEWSPCFNTAFYMIFLFIIWLHVIQFCNWSSAPFQKWKPTPVLVALVAAKMRSWDRM